MTALDQAFIKAFSQQGASQVVLPRQSAAPTSEPRPFPVAPKKEAASLAISDVFRDVLATLEQPSASPTSPIKEKPSVSPASLTKEKPPTTNPTKTEAPPEALPWRSQAESITGAWAADGWQTSLDMPGSICIAESVCIAEPIDLPQVAAATKSLAPTNPIAAPKPVGLANSVGAEAERHVGVAVERPVAAAVAPVGAALELPRQCDAINAQPSTGNSSPSTVAPLSAFLAREAAPSRPDFKPGWQVDRFTWPRVCRRLMTKANDEFDRLADALMTANARGQKILAMAGCCRGEGATTLLLCAARRLADRGVKLVLVDADLARPRIAKRLGVQPQLGWNETSELEGTPLDHAVIEAASNGLTLATVHDPASPTGHTTGDWSRLAPCLEKLKDHYEMILVDLGPLENIQSIGDAMNRIVDGKIDAVLLVHNGRVTSAERLNEVERQLTASGVPLAGMIENFVAV